MGLWLFCFIGDRCERCALENGKEHICNVDVYGAYCWFDGDHNAMCNCPQGYASAHTCEPNGRNCRGYCVVSILCIISINLEHLLLCV